MAKAKTTTEEANSTAGDATALQSDNLPVSASIPAASVAQGPWGAFPTMPVLTDSSNAEAPSEMPVKAGERRAVVNVPGTHVNKIRVAIPRGLSEVESIKAAIQAAKEFRGIVTFGVVPTVDFPDGE